MKRILIIVMTVLAVLPLHAQRPTNYDESKVGPYTLEDPLVFADGKKVKNKADWEKRRQEILDIFQREMYGQMPAAPEDLVLETLEEGATLAGFGHRKQVRMWFRKDKSGPHVDWLIVSPARIQEPVPTILMLNYYGNQTILPDKEILITQSWMRDNEAQKIVNNHSTEESRGIMADPSRLTRYPTDYFVARGYALVTACYADISPDPDQSQLDASGQSLQDTFAYTGIFDLWGERDPSRTDNTTSLAAWAWVLRRGMDMIERDPALDARRVLLTGSSRLGKAALIAGAFDERFPVVVPNQTGGGGAPLAKRYFGENVSTETRSFKHWYCKAYTKYAGREDTLPFDQHMLLACVAPRALLVEGFNKGWFDTKGEFLALQAASPVWKFLGKKGLPDVPWPDIYDTSAIGPTVGYVRRDMEHGIAFIDWLWMLDFAERNFPK